MATPYDNYDPGYSREERRMMEDYGIDPHTGIDLDALDVVRCRWCDEIIDRNDLDVYGACPECVEERGSKGTAFLTAPTMAGCLALMGVR